MEKVIRDGKVAILISKGYGAGWYSWNTDKPQLLFHPKLIELVEQDKRNEITDVLIKELLGLPEDSYTCILGAEKLAIEWLPQGTAFDIEEYDGAESLRTYEDIKLIA